MSAPPPSGADATAGAATVRRWLHRGSALSIGAAAIVGGGLAWLALVLMAPIAADPPYPADEIPAFARAFLASRHVVPLLAVPALVCAALLWRAPRRSIALVLLGSLSLLLPFGVTIACFMALVAPMYTYRPL